MIKSLLHEYSPSLYIYFLLYAVLRELCYLILGSNITDMGAVVGARGAAVVARLARGALSTYLNTSLTGAKLSADCLCVQTSS